MTVPDLTHDDLTAECLAAARLVRARYHDARAAAAEWPGPAPIPQLWR